ncbi:MAG: hypothetical protein Q9M91_02650 [Candidatus Dojkabacteria bacterium]|nr:hypothetical protein [Candidatus Dojkabacteria bacterium]MDQ7020724.1 hypothetical protein [Candidatus Dojkabacteria bacterium]
MFFFNKNDKIALQPVLFDILKKMKGQGILLKNTKLAKFALSKVPSTFLEKKSRKTAKTLFQKALELPAYKSFLKNKKFNPKINYKDFQSIPITNKKNYIQAYSFQELSKDINPHLFYRSSGYSGEPTYWTQNKSDHKSFIEYMDFNLRYTFNIEKKKTLFISTFAMSSWITGQQVLAGLSHVASKYSNVTFFACGMTVDEPLDMIKRFGDQYDQIVMFAYPLTFKEFVDKSSNYGIDLKELNLYAIIGAEGVTYKWSKYYSKKLCRSGKEEYRIISAYGTADTGVGIASEQKPALLLKDLVYENKELRKDITGRDDMPLHFFQYNPVENYLETVNNELIITKDKQIPLIRYNLHDDAEIVPYDKLIKITQDHGLDFKSMLKDIDGDLFHLPLFAIYGRSDDTIILNGANIYINSFKEALHQEGIAHLHTGKFRVKKVDEEDMFQNYHIEVELHEHINSSDELKVLIRETIIKFLLANDKGYKSAYHEPYNRENICSIDFVSFSNEKALKHKYH